MASQNHTTHYGLTQYSDNGTDSISFMSDYNSDMFTIDAKLYALETAIQNLTKMVEGK